MFLSEVQKNLHPIDEWSSSFTNSENNSYGADSYGEQSSEEYRKIFGSVLVNRATQPYCAFCSGKHTESRCKNKKFNKSMQFNSVREMFAQKTQQRLL